MSPKILFILCLLAMFSLIGCGSYSSSMGTKSAYIAYSGEMRLPKAQRKEKVPLYPYIPNYNPSDSSRLNNENYLDSAETGKYKFQVSFYFDYAFIKHLGERSPGNAELLIVSQVKDGENDSVNTVIHFNEDSPKKDVEVTESSFAIYPYLPYTGKPYEITITVVELDNAEEEQTQNFFDFLWNGTNSIIGGTLGFLMPAGIKSFIQQLIKNKDDIELKYTLYRIIPTIADSTLKYDPAHINAVFEKSIIIVKQEHPSKCKKDDKKCLKTFLEEDVEYKNNGKLFKKGDNENPYKEKTYVVLRNENVRKLKKEMPTKESIKEQIADWNKRNQEKLLEIMTGEKQKFIDFSVLLNP